MNERLLTLLARTGGVLTAREARSVGLDAIDLSCLARTKELVRVRRDAYVEASRYHESSPDDRYRLVCRAVLATRGPHEALSHHSAVSTYGIDTFRLDRSVVDIDSPSVESTRIRARVRTHPQALAPQVHNGVKVVPLPLALAQLAGPRGVMSALCSMDNALHHDRCSMADIKAAIEHLQGRHQGSARAALALVDPASESVGESRLRIVLKDLGFDVTTQVDISRGPRFLGRVDALVDDLVAVEFDGLVKYEGVQGSQNLVAEKRRESSITDGGLEFVRVIWSELDDPVALATRVHQARGRALHRVRAADLVTHKAGSRTEIPA